MLPPLDVFKSHMVKLGIQKNHRIVVYDASQQGIFTSPRCAWILKYYGASNVKILNGGLKKWLIDGRAVVENAPIADTEFNEADGDYSYEAHDP